MKASSFPLAVSLLNHSNLQDIAEHLANTPKNICWMNEQNEQASMVCHSSEITFVKALYKLQTILQMQNINHHLQDNQQRQFTKHSTSITSFTSQITKEMEVQTDYEACPILLRTNRIRTPKSNLIPNARLLAPGLLSFLCCCLCCEMLTPSVHNKIYTIILYYTICTTGI